MEIIKLDGRLEEYNEDKIIRSIKNAYSDCGLMCNSSDVKVVIIELKRKTKEMNLLDNRICSSAEIKMLLFRILNESMPKVANKYIYC